MKTKIVLSLLLSLTFCLLSSQVPQGFNYQAIARNPADGTPIIDKPMTVRLTIQSDSLGGTSNIIFWQEVQSVTTNSYGLINLIVGKGTKVQGTAVTFSAIDWSFMPKFIKTEIDYSGWKTMGSSRLWAVPYSMIAGDLGGAIKKLEVLGEDVASDEALFEVKRKDGETMFAVYNYGVRVFMPLDTLSKARKGGFAVGGFSRDKGTIQNYFVVNPDSIRAYIDTNPDKARKGGFAVGGFDKVKAGNEEYLRVTRDSTRIYINDTGSKARKGGFAVGGFDKTKGGNASFLDVATDASGIINPSQNRILWYPLKNAFLTGRILITDSANVGINSFATGFESRAKGKYSQAMGYKAIANGDYSTAIGKNAIAEKINSFAFGENAFSNNEESYAIGRGAVASGYRSFAFGSAGIDTAGVPTDVTQAIGDYTFAIGQGSKSTGMGSFSFGIGNTASGQYSTAIGYKTSASGRFAVALGLNTTASGYISTAMGFNSLSTGDYSTSLGRETMASGSASFAAGTGTIANNNNCVAFGYLTMASYGTDFAMGDHTKAYGGSSVAMGSYTRAKGTNSFAINTSTVASASAATAMGFGTVANSFATLVIGLYNDTTCSSSGWNQPIPTDPLFACGNGTWLNRKNAFTVYKNGNAYIEGSLGIGTKIPSQKLEVNGNVQISGNGFGVWLRDETTGTNWQLHSHGDVLRMYNGSVETIVGAQISSQRWKDNIKPFENILEKINQLQGVTFTWKTGYGKGGNDLGFIAEEVGKVFPELVTYEKNGVDAVALNYPAMSAIAIEGIKELSTKNTVMEHEIASQQQEIETYKSENDILKSQLQTLQEEVKQIKALISRGGMK